jgi:putative membrane protein
MWWHHDWSGWNWFFMVLSMAVFWALVIAVIVWAVHAARGSSDALPRHRSARDTLDDRFARGEITEEEYRRSRDALSER